MLNFLASFLAFQAAAYALEPFPACPVHPNSQVIADYGDGTMKYLGISPAAYAQLPESSPVKLDSALVTGVVDGTLIKYLGIPFAQAPRFNSPKSITSYTGNITADAYGLACPQQSIPNLPANLRYTGPESEDCLSINIIKPHLADSTVKLPVVVWIHGGGFEFGASCQYDELGKQTVLLSVELKKPVIFVSMNYRLSAYGFLASQEVAGEGLGNFGLYDQRVALRWVQSHIDLFGGDASKVTVWGQSAGAMSASLQMLAFGGTSENLFRGVFMQSGAAIPLGPIQSGQEYYKALVTETKCDQTHDGDTLNCLRNVPLEDLRIAVDKSPNVLNYQSLALAWMPRIDGVFLQDAPHNLIDKGKIANVPTVSGTCDDDGTVFSTFENSKNIRTDEDFKNYIRKVWAPDASEEELKPLWTYYTSVASEGSPFGRGDLNLDRPYPQFNRLSAFQGDMVFQGPRRSFTKALSSRGQKTWVYLNKKFKLTPVVGSHHGSDILPKSDFMLPHVVNFINNLDPNIGSGLHWPEYTTEGPESESLQVFTFFTFLGKPKVRLENDRYREAAIAYLTQLAYDHVILA